MCDPLTALAIGSTVAGAAVSATSASQGGAAAQRSAALDAQVASGNADILRSEADIQRAGADLPLVQSALAEQRLRTKVAAITGNQTARFAAAGVDASFGTPLLMQAYTAAQGEVDASIIRANAIKKRADILTQAADTDVQATNQAFRVAGADQKGVDAGKAANLGVATALISGAGKVAGLKGLGSSGGGGADNAFLPSASFLDHGFGFG